MSKEIRMIKGKLYKEECAGNWEPMETNAINDAGVAYRAIQRLLLSITDDEIKRADLMRPELNPLIEAMDTLQAIKALKKNGYTVYSGSKNTPAPKKIETPKSTYNFEDLISKDWDELERIERGM